MLSYYTYCKNTKYHVEIYYTNSHTLFIDVCKYLPNKEYLYNEFSSVKQFQKYFEDEGFTFSQIWNQSHKVELYIKYRKNQILRISK